jgi:hypothetical protein
MVTWCELDLHWFGVTRIWLWSRRKHPLFLSFPFSFFFTKLKPMMNASNSSFNSRLFTRAGDVDVSWALLHYQ